MTKLTREDRFRKELRQLLDKFKAEMEVEEVEACYGEAKIYVFMGTVYEDNKPIEDSEGFYL